MNTALISMITTIITLTYLSCLSSGAMLSMLLLLIGAYVTASLWLINQGAIYTGLLYVLVYVGAIVVLIMFVVQLTNTSLSGDNNSLSSYLLLIQNSLLLISVTILILTAYNLLNSNLILNLSSFNLTEHLTNQNSYLISNLVSHIQTDKQSNNLPVLAFSIFNEYGYILIISIHAILLAIIGPIKLAISDLKPF